MPTANVYASTASSPGIPLVLKPPRQPGIDDVLQAFSEGAALPGPDNGKGFVGTGNSLVGEARLWAHLYWSAPERAKLVEAGPPWLLAGARALGATAKLIQATEVGDDRLDVDLVSVRVSTEFGEVVGLPSKTANGRQAADHHTSLDRLRTILATLPTPRCRSAGERPATSQQRAQRIAKALAQGSGRALSSGAERLAVEYSLLPANGALSGVGAAASPLTTVEGWQCLGLRWTVGLQAAGTVGRWAGELCRRSGRLEADDARLGLEVMASLGLPCVPRTEGRSSLAPLMELRRRVKSRLATLT